MVVAGAAAAGAVLLSCACCASITALFSARRWASSFILSKIPWAEAEAIPHTRNARDSAPHMVLSATLVFLSWAAAKLP